MGEIDLNSSPNPSQSRGARVFHTRAAEGRPARSTAPAAPAASLALIITAALIVGLLTFTCAGTGLALGHRAVAGAGPGTGPAAAAPVRFEHALTVSILDVGQGDAILVSTWDGHRMLVDGGPKKSSGALMAALAARGIDSLDVVVSTHPHEDHIGGLISVLDKVKVGRVLDSGRQHGSTTYADYLSRILDKDIRFSLARAGDSFKLGDATVEILWPSDTLPNDVNDCSIVLLVSYGEFSALLAGDVSSEVEQALGSTGVLHPVVLLKVGHHGSKASTAKATLDRVAPKLAVISVGSNNQYGHPDPTTLSRLQASGADVYRTDLHGTVEVLTDGKKWAVRTTVAGPTK